MENFLTSLYPWLEVTYYGNTVRAYLIALGILLGFWIFFRVVKYRLFRILKRLFRSTQSHLDEPLIVSFESIPGLLYFFAALFLALQVIDVHPLVNKVVGVILTIWILYWLSKVISKIVEYGLSQFTENQGEKTISSIAIIFILKLGIWTLGFLLILSNLGIDITALVTSLGIGGIAVALAVQNILGDMFSSFTIYLDKPFEIGDYIVIGEHSGTVKKIGLKSTRIQALQGEEIVISNKELTTTRIQNFKRMTKRRIAFEIGISAKTSSAMLAKVPKMIEKIIKARELVDFERAHFKSFDPTGFKFEIVYYMKTSEYKDFMNTQEKINLELLKTFEKEKIDLAFTGNAGNSSKEKKRK